MFDVIKKAVFAGIGLGFVAKEKVEEMGKKLIEEAKLGEAEGRKFIDELKKKSEDARLALEKTVNDAVAAAFKKIDIVRRQDIEKLEKRIAELEQAQKKGK